MRGGGLLLAFGRILRCSRPTRQPAAAVWAHVAGRVVGALFASLVLLFVVWLLPASAWARLAVPLRRRPRCLRSASLRVARAAVPPCVDSCAAQRRGPASVAAGPLGPCPCLAWGAREASLPPSPPARGSVSCGSPCRGSLRSSASALDGGRSSRQRPRAPFARRGRPGSARASPAARASTLWHARGAACSCFAIFAR